jgi:ATP-binding cassette subfamily B protein
MSWRALSMMLDRPLLAAFYAVLVVVISLMPVGQAWLSKLIVDDLANASLTLTGVLVLGTLYALTLVLPAALEPVQHTLSVWLEDQAVAKVDHRLMEAGARLADLSRMEQPTFHDELRVARESIYYAPRFFQALKYLVGTGLTLVGLLFLLATLNPLIPLALATATIPHLMAERKMHFLTYQTMREHSRAAREMDYCARITTEAAGAKEVRVFGLGDFFLGRFRERFEEAFSAVSRIRMRQLRVSACFGALHALALAGGFWYVAAQAGAGQLSLGDLALYLNAVTQAEGLVFLLPFWSGFVYQMYLYLRGLFAFVDQAEPQIKLPSPGQGRPAPATLRSCIELKGVGFIYPESEAPVLEELDAVLPAGKVTALVGENGAGKSTLVKLLTRMYDPAGGKILLDGVPLHSYDLDSLRQRIAVVYQDFARFSLTLGENIAIGDPESEVPDSRVELAAQLAGADMVASKLPQGYDTMLTRRFEDGVDLSGGEWQKVATARGFVRDAAIVILDEPSAALDADAERRLFERFGELVAGKTALLISHRFSTVRMADHILVLEGGCIIEFGRHTDLMRLGRRYAELYEMQAARYR